MQPSEISRVTPFLEDVDISLTFRMARKILLKPVPIFQQTTLAYRSFHVFDQTIPRFTTKTHRYRSFPSLASLTSNRGLASAVTSANGHCGRRNGEMKQDCDVKKVAKLERRLRVPKFKLEEKLKEYSKEQQRCHNLEECLDLERERVGKLTRDKQFLAPFIDMLDETQKRLEDLTEE
ncbi:unnamed protein product [Sphagnum balticum]